MRTTTVATLAPHIDRLALCVHGPAGRNPELRAELQALDLPPGSMLVVAARLLAHDGLRPGDLANLVRYQPRSWTAANERTHVERGLLVERTDGVLEPSPAFRRAAELVLRVQADAAAELWRDEDDHADAAAAAADELVAVAVATVDLDAHPTFVRQVETRPSTATAASRLLAAVTELRYLRADAHTAALAAAGVRPADAIGLTKRWKGFGEPLDPADAAVRRAIEDDTDRRVAAALHDDAIDRLLAAVEHLPGDDPRPPEDR